MPGHKWRRRIDRAAWVVVLVYAALVAAGFLLSKDLSARGLGPAIGFGVVAIAGYAYWWRRADLDHEPHWGRQLYVLRRWEAKRFVKKELEQVSADTAAER